MFKTCLQVHAAFVNKSKFLIQGRPKANLVSVLDVRRGCVLFEEQSWSLVILQKDKSGNVNLSYLQY